MGIRVYYNNSTTLQRPGPCHNVCRNESFFYLVTPLKRIDFPFIGYWTSNMTIVTYFFRGNLLSPHRPRFLICRMRFIYLHF